MKYTLSDIKLKSPGVQIREKILEKYDSVKDFADAIDLYETSIHQYLSSKTLGSSTFKIRTMRALDVDFNDLFLSDEEQIRVFTSNTSLYIDEYNRIGDIELLEKLKKLVLERELLEDYAVVCRSYAYFFINQGKKDRAYAYIDVAVNTMRGRENIDRFGLYLSDLIQMKIKDMSATEFKKIKREFEATIKAVTGPLTTGHMYRNIAKAYFVMGDLANSEKYYKKVFDYHEDKESRSYLYIRLGDIRKHQGRFEEAIDYYKSAENLVVEGTREKYYVYDEYANYYQESDLQLAEVYIDKIFNSDWIISSSDHGILMTFVKIKAQLKKYEDILKVFQRLLRDLDTDYIYTINQLKKFGSALTKDAPDALLVTLKEQAISYFKQRKMSLEYENAIKELIGSIEITRAYM